MIESGPNARTVQLNLNPFTLVGATASSSSGGDMLLIPNSFCTVTSNASTGEITGTCFGSEGIFGINSASCCVLTELQDLNGTITDITDIILVTWEDTNIQFVEMTGAQSNLTTMRLYLPTRKVNPLELEFLVPLLEN